MRFFSLNEINLGRDLADRHIFCTIALMRFTKMHGLGNDYIYIDGPLSSVAVASELARAVSNRHTGIGGDGLIIIEPSSLADLRMTIYNADGSRAQMCGNGLRCVAKYAVDRQLVSSMTMTIETDAGLRHVECLRSDATLTIVRVNMGVPILDAKAMHISIDASPVLNYPMTFDGQDFFVTCVSMGNPHAVIIVPDISAILLTRLGPKIETAPVFQQRINVHFVQVDNAAHLTMKTWERGSGATQACGTGACAVCVAGVLTERCGRSVQVTLPGGGLDVEWASDDHVYMEGPAVEVFTGDWPV